MSELLRDIVILSFIGLILNIFFWARRSFRRSRHKRQMDKLSKREEELRLEELKWKATMEARQMSAVGSPFEDELEQIHEDMLKAERTNKAFDALVEKNGVWCLSFGAIGLGIQGAFGPDSSIVMKLIGGIISGAGTGFAILYFFLGLRFPVGEDGIPFWYDTPTSPRIHDIDIQLHDLRLLSATFKSEIVKSGLPYSASDNQYAAKIDALKKERSDAEKEYRPPSLPWNDPDGELVFWVLFAIPTVVYWILFFI